MREGEALVRERMVDSSVGDMGWRAMGKNMFACSSDSQSLRGRDLDAVTMTRKEGCVTDNSPDDICKVIISISSAS